MHTKPLPRVIAGAVVVMVTVSAFLTFTRGEAPASDSASATLPGIASGNRPTVEGSATTPPTSPASADAAEREAKKIKKGTTKSPSASPSTGGGPQWTPTPVPNPQPEPEPEPEPEPTHKPSPTPSPKPSCSFVGTVFGCR